MMNGLDQQARREFLAAFADMDKPDARERLGRVLEVAALAAFVLAIVAGLGFAMLVFVHWD